MRINYSICLSVSNHLFNSLVAIALEYLKNRLLEYLNKQLLEYLNKQLLEYLNKQHGITLNILSMAWLNRSASFMSEVKVSNQMNWDTLAGKMLIQF
jgi:hypothetical protein